MPPFLRKRSPDGATSNRGSKHPIAAYYSLIDPQRGERLSWPVWLTYRGWFTHINGHPSATSQAQVFYDESCNSMYFRVKRSKVKVTSHKYCQCGTLHSSECRLLPIPSIFTSGANGQTDRQTDLLRLFNAHALVTLAERRVWSADDVAVFE